MRWPRRAHFSSWAFRSCWLGFKKQRKIPAATQRKTRKIAQRWRRQGVAASFRLSRQHPPSRKAIAAGSIRHPKIRIGANGKRAQPPPVLRLRRLLRRHTLAAAIVSQKPRSPPRQLDPIFHPEFAQQSRDVKLHGPHRDVQHGSDLFICLVTQNRVKNLFLPGAQRARTRNCTPFF
jgi:hypothetical protein